MTAPISIGVSACLLGQQVRYDGGHKRDRYITDTLGRIFHIVPVCPEVGCGLPVPREAMRLEGDPAAPRLMTIRTRIDLTGRMSTYCREKVAGLESAGLCGFIFKKNSPSCGLSGVTIFHEGVAAARGAGLFAAAMAGQFPRIPMEEEDRLSDAAIRATFIDRVRSYSLRKN